MGVFEYKKIELRAVLPMCVCFSLYITLTNLSLLYNSVNFSQLVKILTTPLMVFVQRTYYGQRFPIQIQCSLVLICLGVALSSAKDAEANVVGTLSALGATVRYQIDVGEKQTEMQCRLHCLLS